MLDDGLVFVDGEVEGGGEQAVFPRFPFLEGVAEFPFAGEEVGNQRYRSYKKEHLQDSLARQNLLYTGLIHDFKGLFFAACSLLYAFDFT